MNFAFLKFPNKGVPMSSSSNVTSSSNKIFIENEVVGSRPAGCMCVPLKKRLGGGVTNKGVYSHEHLARQHYDIIYNKKKYTRILPLQVLWKIICWSKIWQTSSTFSPTILMGEVSLNYELQTMAAIQRIIYNWPYVSFFLTKMQCSWKVFQQKILTLESVTISR